MSTDWEASSAIAFDDLSRLASHVRLDYDVGEVLRKPHVRLSMPTNIDKPNRSTPDSREYLWAVKMPAGQAEFIRYGPNDPHDIAAVIELEFGVTMVEGW